MSQQPEMTGAKDGFIARMARGEINTPPELLAAARATRQAQKLAESTRPPQNGQPD